MTKVKMLITMVVVAQEVAVPYFCVIRAHIIAASGFQVPQK